MKNVRSAAIVLALLMAVACGGGGDEATTGDSATADASVEFSAPEDGATVTNPVKVQMEATGVTIEPAASGVHENAGHFHVLVDTECMSEGQVIPNDDTHLHYGMAQTEAELTLPPGEHELCLQVGNGNHAALPLTDTINVTVE